MIDVLRWLITPAITLSPMGLLGFAFIYSGVREYTHRALRRRKTDVIDLPGGGRIEVIGYPTGFLADVVELTGGKLRPRGGRR